MAKKKATAKKKKPTKKVEVAELPVIYSEYEWIEQDGPQKGQMGLRLISPSGMFKKGHRQDVILEIGSTEAIDDMMEILSELHGIVAEQEEDPEE